MSSEKTKSPLGFVLVAAVLLAVAAVWFLRGRGTAPAPAQPAASAKPAVAPQPAQPPKPTEPADRPDTVIHVADTSAAPRPAADLLSPQAPVASPDDPVIRERALIRALHAALKQAGEASAETQTEDLLAVLFFSRMEPLPPKPSAADVDAAIVRRKQMNESVLAGSSVFLNPGQLKIYAKLLEGEVEFLRTQRAGAR